MYININKNKEATTKDSAGKILAYKISVSANISLKDISLNRMDNKIIPSKIIKKHVVPESTKFLYPYYMWGLYPSVYITIKWDIYDMKFTDLNQIILYKFLF